ENFVEVLSIEANDFPAAWRRRTKPSSRLAGYRWALRSHDWYCQRRDVLKICAFHTETSAAEVRTLPQRFSDDVLTEIRKFRRPVDRFEISLIRVIPEQSNISGRYNVGSKQVANELGVLR